MGKRSDIVETSFYTSNELVELGLKSYGKNVLISRKVSIYGAEQIEIGNNVRIDDFCILSGKILLGNNIHISAYTVLYAGNVGIEIRDFAGISARGTVYAKSDDYSGYYLINPMVPKKYLNVIEGKVILGKYVQIGAGCVIMPNVQIGDGSVVGSMSFINKSLDTWGIYAGIPCKFIKQRSKKLLELEAQYLN